MLLNVINRNDMKLYEFTFTDNENLSESDVLEGLQDFLKTEAEMQGWVSGYNLRQCKEVVQLPDGKRIFTFEVLGQYIDSNSVDFNDHLAAEVNTKSHVAVAKDASL